MLTSKQKIVKLKRAVALLERVDELQQECIDGNLCMDIHQQLDTISAHLEYMIQVTQARAEKK